MCVCIYCLASHTQDSLGLAGLEGEGGGLGGDELVFGGRGRLQMVKYIRSLSFAIVYTIIPSLMVWLDDYSSRRDSQTGGFLCLR